ncbi:hypothetical protein [Rahnella bruchi]|uniref:hypothetical protein n=1 Tax=Rahnella bruchi TaxID=1510573 RepID=UPI0013C4197B|nr:hypothetical protein [Rahnella bruchi]
MHHSQCVLIDSSCKLPDALPELREKHAFSELKQKKINMGDVVTYIFPVYPGMYFSVLRGSLIGKIRRKTACRTCRA